MYGSSATYSVQTPTAQNTGHVTATPRSTTSRALATWAITSSTAINWNTPTNAATRRAPRRSARPDRMLQRATNTAATMMTARSTSKAIATRVAPCPAPMRRPRRCHRLHGPGRGDHEERRTAAVRSGFDPERDPRILGDRSRPRGPRVAPGRRHPFRRRGRESRGIDPGFAKQLRPRRRGGRRGLIVSRRRARVEIRQPPAQVGAHERHPRRHSRRVAFRHPGAAGNLQRRHQLGTGSAPEVHGRGPHLRQPVPLRPHLSRLRGKLHDPVAIQVEGFRVSRLRVVGTQPLQQLACLDAEHLARIRRLKQRKGRSLRGRHRGNQAAGDGHHQRRW